jgi:serine phosphatase RsbU (regulator of sigma subunit)
MIIDWSKFLHLSILTLFCVALFSCNTNVTIKPGVNRGILDLKDIEDTISNPVRLDGTWKFYWHHLIENKQQLQIQKPPVEYITVPAPWNKQKHFKSYPAHGYGTYHITMLHSKNTIGSVMYIKMPFTYTSHAIFINGIPIARSGFVADNKHKMVPNQLPSIIQFIVQSPTTDIFIQVANFQQRNGGIIHPVYYGTPKIITSFHNRSIYMQLFVFASLFVIGIYHMGLYFINKSKQNIFIGIFSLIVALRILVINEMLLISFFNPPWGLNFRLSYLTVTISPILFCHFVNSVYPNKIKNYNIFITNICFGFFTLLVCIAPLHIISSSLIFIQLVLVYISIYLLIILIKETGKNLKTKRIFYVGLILGFACMINDILYSHQIIKTINSSHFGILIFVVTQSMIAFEEYIIQQQRLILLSHEMNIAKKIQRNIMPSEPPSLHGVTIDILYLPVNTLGSDFYHFFEIDNKHAGIFIADFTGHGIPASMIASTVNIAFTLQYDHAAYPDTVLSNMNNLLIGKTGNQPITALYCYLDMDNMTARLSRAGHSYPLYFNSKSGTVEEIKTQGNVMGISPSADYVSTQFNIHNGDKLILYTDGLIEIRNKYNHLFDVEKLKQSIINNQDLKASEFTNRLINDVLQWAGSKENITDDITIITIDIG